MGSQRSDTTEATGAHSHELHLDRKLLKDPAKPKSKTRKEKKRDSEIGNLTQKSREWSFPIDVCAGSLSLT